MASRHSLTIQLAEPSMADGSPGHAAAIVNTPDGQTYAGLGPADHDLRSLKGAWSTPKFAPQVVPPGQLPDGYTDPNNFNTVFGHSAYATHTIPLTEEQARAALAEIGRIRAEGNNYNIFNKNVCTAIVNRILKAAGVGSDVLYTVPARSQQYLSEIEKANPKPKFVLDGAGRPVPVPEQLRDMQEDYAFVGGGYDTPSERLGRFPEGVQSLADGDVSPHAQAKAGVNVVPGRYLRSRPADSATPNAFDGGTAPVPFIPHVSLAPQTTPAGQMAGSPDQLIAPSQQMWPPGRDEDTSPADFNDWYTRWVKTLLRP
jgi:hypothetical protein